MNCLLLIIGESFRTGGQGTRTRGNPESHDEQINACNTHIKFIQHLKEKYNVSTSVSLFTYTTQYDEELKQKYSDYLINSHFYPNLIGLNTLFHNSYKDIETSKYNFIFYIRVDLFLKDEFFNIFNPEWKTVRFPTICWVLWCRVNLLPRVNDMMLFIPNKYFNVLDKFIIHHETWVDLIEKKILTIDDLDTMINTYHDSDSEKDYNPMYYIVNRPRNEKWHSEGHIFDKNNFTETKALSLELKKYKIYSPPPRSSKQNFRIKFDRDDEPKIFNSQYENLCFIWRRKVSKKCN